MDCVTVQFQLQGPRLGGIAEEDGPALQFREPVTQEPSVNQAAPKKEHQHDAKEGRDNEDARNRRIEFHGEGHAQISREPKAGAAEDYVETQVAPQEEPPVVESELRKC